MLFLKGKTFSSTLALFGSLSSTFLFLLPWLLLLWAVFNSSLSCGLGALGVIQTLQEGGARKERGDSSESLWEILYEKTVWMQNWLVLIQSYLLSLNSTNHRIEQWGCSHGWQCSHGEFRATKGDICHTDAVGFCVLLWAEKKPLPFTEISAWKQDLNALVFWLIWEVPLVWTSSVQPVCPCSKVKRFSKAVVLWSWRIAVCLFQGA